MASLAIWDFTCIKTGFILVLCPVKYQRITRNIDFLFCSFYDINLLIFNNQARHVMLAVYKVHSTR